MITDGEYSDYRVCGICSTPENAAYAKRLYGAANDVQEIEIDALPEHPHGMLR